MYNVRKQVYKTRQCNVNFHTPVIEMAKPRETEVQSTFQAMHTLKVREQYMYSCTRKRTRQGHVSLQGSKYPLAR